PWLLVFLLRFQLSLQEQVVIFTGHIAIIISIGAGIVFSSEKTFFYDHAFAFANGAYHFAQPFTVNHFIRLSVGESILAVRKMRIGIWVCQITLCCDIPFFAKSLLSKVEIFLTTLKELTVCSLQLNIFIQPVDALLVFAEVIGIQPEIITDLGRKCGGISKHMTKFFVRFFIISGH